MEQNVLDSTEKRGRCSSCSPALTVPRGSDNLASLVKIAADIGWYAWKFFVSHAVKATPAALVRTGRALGAALAAFRGRRRRVALDYISVALPELSEKEKRRIYRRSSQNLAVAFLETFHYGLNWPRGLGNFRVEGEEHLRGARGGAVLLTAHVGCFPVMLGLLAERGHPVADVLRAPHDRRAARLIDAGAAKTKLIIIPDKPQRACARACLEHVRSGGILALPIDLHPGHRGVEVEYFGRPTPTFAGPASIALKTGVPVIPVFAHRDRRNPVKHVVTVMEPMELVRTGSREKDILVNLREMNRIIERAIRTWPEDMWWIHRRWK